MLYTDPHHTSTGSQRLDTLLAKTHAELYSVMKLTFNFYHFKINHKSTIYDNLPFYAAKCLNVYYLKKRVKKQELEVEKQMQTNCKYKNV